MTVEECLARIAEREPLVQAWEVVDAEGALAAPRGGPLRGLPVGIKDLIDTADLPTTYGSPIFRGHRPARDAACVAALKKAGAVILGKTVTSEFALFHPGKTRNPRDLSRTPGGSSSGSAAAVADGMVPAALGSQTAASIVRPASFCGCIGWKPTFGLLPMQGVRPMAPSLDTLGFFVRDLSLVAPLYEALAGVTLRERDAKPRLALCRTEAWPQAEPATRAAIEREARALGATEEVTLGPGLVEAQMAIMGAEAAEAMRDLPEAQLSSKLRAFLAAGRAVTPAQVQAARERVITGVLELERALQSRDALITPAAAGEAPADLTITGDPLFSRIWTLLGAPCASLPLLQGPAGMPLGVQLVGRRGDDETLLAAARWILAAA